MQLLGEKCEDLFGRALTCELLHCIVGYCICIMTREGICTVKCSLNLRRTILKKLFHRIALTIGPILYSTVNSAVAALGNTHSQEGKLEEKVLPSIIFNN